MRENIGTEQLPVVASLSGGKDSVAMLLAKKYKKAIFYDTGKEFNAIYNVIEKLRKNGENTDQMELLEINDENLPF